MASSVKPPSNIMNVKGHMVTKSSALSAGNSKLESQFITAQNMASHYKRVINAKSAINTLPPKSITCSQKSRDRAKREMLNCSQTRKSLNTSRAKSVDVSRNDISLTEDSTTEFTSSKTQQKSTTSTATAPKSTKSVYRDVINRNIVVQEWADPKPLPDQKKLNKSMSNMMATFTKSKTTTARSVHMSPRASMNATTPTNMFAQKFNFMGDKTKGALENLVFNNQNVNLKASTSDFQMQSNPALKAMSRLVAGRHYDVLDNHAQKFVHPNKQFQPRIKNTKTASSLSKSSSTYQPPRRRKNRQTSTALGSQVSLRNDTSPQKSILSEHLNKSVRSNHDEEINSDIEDIENDAEIHSRNRSNLMNRSANSNVNRSYQRKNSVDNELELKKEAEKEQEIQYLEFIKEVTNDVIARGISSNRVINTCFEYHVNKKKHMLDENKMRELLNTLKKDIGITDEEGSTENRKNSISDERTDNNYLTLQKLGQNNSSSPKRRGSKSSLNNSRRNEDATNDMFDNYENQIAQNIQSIRRNSAISLEGEYQNKENNNPQNRSLNRSQRSSSSRKSSTESVEFPGQKQTSSILKKTNYSPDLNVHKNNLQTISDSESDLETNKNVISRRSSAGSNRSQTKEAPKPKTIIVREQESDDDDDIFNDNYGEESEEEGELKQVNTMNKQDGDSDDDDDDFDSMLKTKSFSNSRNKLAHAMKTKDDEMKEQSFIARATTPRPVPRKTNVQDRQDAYSGSSDDEY